MVCLGQASVPLSVCLLQVCVVQFSNDTRVEVPLGPLDKPAFDAAISTMVRRPTAVLVWLYSAACVRKRQHSVTVAHAALCVCRLCSSPFSRDRYLDYA